MKRELSKAQGPSLFAALVAAIAAIALSGACQGPQGVQGDQGQQGAQGQQGQQGQQGNPAPVFFTVTYDLGDGYLPGIPAGLSSENVIVGGKVRMPIKIPVREAEGNTLSMPAGLYSTTGGILNHTFAGWYWDDDGDEETEDVLWDFDDNVITAETTIKAGWGDPAPVPVEPNNIAAAVAHINTLANAGEYVLVLDNKDTSDARAAIPAGPQALTQNGIDLTIRALNSEQEITLSSNGILFDIGPATANGNIVKLTIRENITLKGRSAGGNGNANNNNPLVRIRNGGTLLMEEDSKITGNTSSQDTESLGCGAAVIVANGLFTMRDTATITGNFATNNYYSKNAGGVYVADTSAARFVMEDESSVTGNTNAGVSKYDVFVRSQDSVPTSGSLTMGGGASIGILGLESRTNNVVNTVCVTIVSAMTNETHIKLWADPGGLGLLTPNITNIWKSGAIILRGTMEYDITEDDIAQFIIDGIQARGANNYTAGGLSITFVGAPQNTAILSGR
jgi:hypothetical protein